MKRAFLIVCLLGSSLTASGDELEVALVLPEPGQSIFGETEIAAEVYPPSSKVERVEFYLDGLRVGTVRTAPYSLSVNAGQENVGHTIEVVAYPETGNPVSQRIKTPRLQSDLEVDVDLRQLFVTATKDRKRYLSLEREDFEIYDNRLRHDIVTFGRGEIPFTAVVLLDASESMRGEKLETALQGMRTFLNAMNTLDEAKAILFSDHIRAETPFSGQKSILLLYLEGAEAGGGTALNDALYLGLKRLESGSGRPVLILLSDGVDIDSALSMAQVERVTRKNRVLIYWIQLPRGGTGKGGSRRISAWRNSEQHEFQFQSLYNLVVNSGGRIESVAAVDEVDAAFGRIISELREQYVLGYYPRLPLGPGSKHEIEVKVSEPKVKLRTIREYEEE
jgi:Ca-activated chloride channel family protein